MNPAIILLKIILPYTEFQEIFIMFLIRPNLGMFFLPKVSGTKLINDVIRLSRALILYLMHLKPKRVLSETQTSIHK